jgi:hypothetical protein
MSVTAEGLVAVLGWCVDDFELSCREASPAVLDGALSILIAPDPPDTPDWVVERARWGARFIERRLGLSPSP